MLVTLRVSRLSPKIRVIGNITTELNIKVTRIKEKITS